MGMIATIVCGTAFAGNLNEIKASAVSDDDLSSSTPDKIVSPSSVSETKANIKLETMKLGGTFKANVAE